MLSDIMGQLAQNQGRHLMNRRLHLLGLEDPVGIVAVDMTSARNFTYEKTDASTLTLHWQEFDHVEYPDLHSTSAISCLSVRSALFELPMK